MMNKKVFSMILALSMLVSVYAFPISGHAALGIEHEAQVSKLNAFGILTGYPDTNYKASDNVSAKEFVTAAYKLAGIDFDFTGTMASKFGFKADDKSITIQNAVAVLLTALNYSEEAEYYGGYPNGYNKVASNNKLLDGIAGGSAGNNLTKDSMAVLLYNALDLDVLEPGGYSNGFITYSHTDKTVMENLKIYEGKGIVTGTQYTSINGCSKAGGNEIIIDDTEHYSLGKTYADELFGYSVEYYYNDDDELLWIDTRNNMTVTRVAEIDIISFEESGISFYNENDRKKSYSFDNATFTYNGKSVKNLDFESFVPSSGYINIIDNDNDGKAEVVSSKSYEYYLVSEKNVSNETVNDYEVNRQISLNPNDYDSIKIIKDGKTISFSEIEENDIIAVMKSDDSGGVVRAFVSTYKPVSGNIKATSSGYIKIDDTVYDVSTAYEGTTLSTGKSGVFYFDINGNIVRFIQGKNTTSQYAYLISAYIADNGEDCYMRFLTAGGNIEEHLVYRKVRYNGESISPKTLFSKISSDGTTEKQLITYSLNSDGAVNKVETANKNNLYSGKDEPLNCFAQYFQGHGRYRKNNMCFNSKYLIDADTPIFVVPSSREKADYEVRYAASLTNGTSYYISVYDIDEYMTAGAIVLDEIASDPEQLKAKRSIIVDNILIGINDDDEQIVILEGYQQGSKITLKTKDQPYLKDSEGRYYSLGKTEGYTELYRGDVIQASLDSDGNLLAFRTLYKADESKKKLVIAPNETPNEYEEGGNVNEFADLFILHGEVTSRSSNVLVVESDTKRAHKITNGVSVYIVEGRGVEKGTTSDIYVYDEVYLHTYQGNLQEVIIYR